MVRVRNSHGFTALKVEGGILPPEYLQTIATLHAPRQDGADYGLSRSLILKEELARFWRIANDFYDSYSKRRMRRDLNAQSVGVDDWLVPLLRTVFGYDDLVSTGRVSSGERVFKLTHRAGRGTVPFLLVTRDFSLDRADARFGFEGRRQAPHGLVQEYLNAEDKCLWGFTSNGSKLRLLRDNPSLTRPAYIEVDLELVFEEHLYPDFTALWLAAHASRLTPTNDKPSECIIEDWRAKAHETGERVLEHLRDGVTDALRQVGNGFLQHPDNNDLRSALHDGKLTSEDYFQQLLRLIYRMLFLFTTEERNLLHAPDATDEQRAVFIEGYSLSRLRERALRRRYYDHHQDIWHSLRITFSALARGAPALGLPALGGLFQDEQCPDLDAAAISNERLLDAIRGLAFFRSGTTLAHVNYRDMDTEELGSVYESLLELQPVVDVDSTPWTFRFAGDTGSKQSRGSARKLTGSYYTPSSLVNELIKSTLEPVLADAVERRPDNPRQAILDLKVIDPACGSGHFLLAAARRMAAEIARIEADADTFDEAVRQHALREVVRHCIHGVDRNPLAVELCKTALWIETIEPGKPLTFLDAHIQLGDSLVGILDPEVIAEGIPAEAYKPLTTDDKDTCKALKKRNKQTGDSMHSSSLFVGDGVHEVARATAEVDTLPEDTLDDIKQKSAAWDAARSDETHKREELRANLFVGAYFAPKTPQTTRWVPLTEDLNRLNESQPQRPEIEDRTTELARRHHFLHWHLAFAEIMQNGGFDVVLGNPPWEQVQLDPREFFAVKNKEIANKPTMAARNKAIKELTDSDPGLHAEYQSALSDMKRVQHFIHSSGRFPKTSYGRLNSAPLFTELILSLLNPRGLAGIITPTGIATDSFNQYFFSDLIERRALVSLYDFENREAVFPGVHRSYKFCLLTLSGTDRPCPEAEFAFFLYQPEQLGEQERRFFLSAEDFALFNPNTRTCPIFRTRRDIEIARKMYRRSGVFWKEKRNNEPEVNPWGVNFQLMFMMNTDSNLFRIREELDDEGWELRGNVFHRDEERYLPLYEAKLFHQYDHRFATFEGVSTSKAKKGKARKMTSAEKADPEAVVLPRYWIPEEEVVKKLDKSERGQLSLSSAERAATHRIGSQAGNKEPAPPPPRSERSTDSPNWLAVRSQGYHQLDQRADRNPRHDSLSRARPYRYNNPGWLVVFRDIARATDQRTSIFAAVRGTAMSGTARLLEIDYTKWLQVFRDITNSTNERTALTGSIPWSGVGNSAPVIDYTRGRAIASALVLANMNSLPLDWAARFSVGGVHMSFFIVKQLPVLPPEAYLDRLGGSQTATPRYVEVIVPRVLELTYTSVDLEGFAMDIGYHDPPFPWDDQRRHRLQSELDAIYAHMYDLDRPDLEWILDAQPPSSSFPALKRNELTEFGEYRTQRYVLSAYDQITRGEIPNLTDDEE